MVRILLLSRELLVDVLGVIDVVRQGSVLGVLNYDELDKDDLLTDSTVILVDILRSLGGEEADLGSDVVSSGHPSSDGSLCALGKRFAVHVL
jgi:hypothetical protein